MCWLRKNAFIGKDENHFISIMEKSVEVTVIGNEPFQIYNINDIKILEQNSGLLLRTGYLYSWNKDKSHFDVHVVGYDRTEGRKVVESMINSRSNVVSP